MRPDRRRCGCRYVAASRAVRSGWRNGRIVSTRATERHKHEHPTQRRSTYGIPRKLAPP